MGATRVIRLFGTGGAPRAPETHASALSVVCARWVVAQVVYRRAISAEFSNSAHDKNFETHLEVRHARTYAFLEPFVGNRLRSDHAHSMEEVEYHTQRLFLPPWKFSYAPN